MIVHSIDGSQLQKASRLRFLLGYHLIGEKPQQSLANCEVPYQPRKVDGAPSARRLINRNLRGTGGRNWCCRRSIRPRRHLFASGEDVLCIAEVD